MVKGEMSYKEVFFLFDLPLRLFPFDLFPRFIAVCRIERLRAIQ
jgi:hypothetical protein